MRIVELELGSFRNWRALRFDPPGGVCVLVGANAQGKSNLLEGLSLLALGKSFRAARETDLVGLDAPAARVSARIRTRAGSVEVSCMIARAGDGARKTFVRNGRRVPYGQFLGGVVAVTFEPSDLQLVAGPARLRRRLLNITLSQSGRAYYGDLALYDKILSQKNALLRSPDGADRGLLTTYNEQLAAGGSRITSARSAYIRRLGQEAAVAHARWVGARAPLVVRYAPVPAQPDETPAAIENTLREALAAAMPAELARRMSVVGPHRDDVVLLLDDGELARYGSQGQQRTAVLALKAAEYALLHQAIGEAPLLLLDDVLSELDAQRRRAFLDSLTGFEQAFVTATDFPEQYATLGARGEGASIFIVRDGGLIPQAQRASA